MVSATEAELGGLFENCHKITSMITSFSEMVKLTTTNTGGNLKYSGKQRLQFNRKIYIQSNIHEILLGQRQNKKNSSHIFWEEEKKKAVDYVKKTPLNMVP